MPFKWGCGGQEVHELHHPIHFSIDLARFQAFKDLKKLLKQLRYKCKFGTFASFFIHDLYYTFGLECRQRIIIKSQFPASSQHPARQEIPADCHVERRLERSGWESVKMMKWLQIDEQPGSCVTIISGVEKGGLTISRFPGPPGPPPTNYQAHKLYKHSHTEHAPILRTEIGTEGG